MLGKLVSRTYLESMLFRSVVFNQWTGDDHQWSLKGFQVVPS